MGLFNSLEQYVYKKFDDIANKTNPDIIGKNIIKTDIIGKNVVRPLILGKNSTGKTALQMFQSLGKN